MTYQNNVELPLELQPPLLQERPAGSRAFVRISESYLLCVVYLGWPRAGSDNQIDPVGTGFLVEHDGAHYIVTAAHVAKNFNGVPFGIRLNKKADGTGQVERLDSAEWMPHPDSSIDVAVLPFSPPQWARAHAFHTRNSLTEFKRETKRIGPGDIAYVVGIFKLLPGDQKNNPIVHVGHLASWAEGEGIPTFDWTSDKYPPPETKINGYLVQVHTLSQSSGSPVFVRRAIPYKVLDPFADTIVDGDGTAKHPTLGVGLYGSVWLLGLWHGAFADDIGKRLGIKSLSQAGLEYGMGMGICIPAPRILEALDAPQLVEMRNAARKEKAESTIKVVPQSDRMIEKERDRILAAGMRSSPKPRRAPKAKRPKRGRA